VVRGGSWGLPSGRLRSALRYGYRAGDRLRVLGFRVFVPPGTVE